MSMTTPARSDRDPRTRETREIRIEESPSRLDRLRLRASDWVVDAVGWLLLVIGGWFLLRNLGLLPDLRAALEPVLTWIGQHAELVWPAVVLVVGGAILSRRR